MIYLASVRSSEIDEIKDRFRSGGIPIFTAPDYTITDGMPGGIGLSARNAEGRPDWYSISICLDEQLEEGKRLFKDADYKVFVPVDVDEFEAKMDKLGANREFEWRFSDNGLLWIVLAVIVGFVICILRAVSIASH